MFTEVPRMQTGHASHSSHCNHTVILFFNASPVLLKYNCKVPSTTMLETLSLWSEACISPYKFSVDYLDPDALVFIIT